MQSGVKNRNGRVYPKSVLFNETKRYRREFVEKNRAFGELGHPKGPSINLDRISHMFTELKEDGLNIVGRAKIMDTPMGKIVKNLIDEGAQLGISSRGIGSMKKTSGGIMEVQNDFMLASAGDIVADPSAPNAFVNGIMEGKKYWYDLAEGTWREENSDNAQLEEVVEEIKKEASKMTQAQIDENCVKFFDRFVRSLD